MKICYIEKCYQCRYLKFNNSLIYIDKGYCEYSCKEIENIYCDIPKWCELEDRFLN